MGLEDLPPEGHEELGRIAKRVLHHNRAAVAQLSDAMVPALEANRRAVLQVVQAAQTANRSLMESVQGPALHSMFTQMQQILEKHHEALATPLVQASSFAALKNEEFWRDLIAVVEEVQRRRAAAAPIVEETKSQGVDLARLDQAIRWVARAIAGSIVDEVPMIVMLYCLALMLSLRLALAPEEPLKLE